MNPERWRRIEELYLGAIELAPEARGAYLDAACSGDAELRDLVERMLARGEQASLPEPPSGDRVIAALRKLASDLQGTRLGDFVLREEIGRGGMGAVYRARQEGLDRDVAVKVLPPPLYDDELAVERFRRESLAAARLRHPGIVPILAAGREQGLFYYAMELVDGWSLRHLLQERELAAPELTDPAVCASLIRDVADALAHSHAQGILHRDIKPQNVLIERRSGTPRLIDFGLAKVLDLEAISRTGDAAGTPLYMSPEQVRAKAIDERTDVYSAGAVLYELLTGSPPFPGRTSHEILLGITQGLLQPVRARRPEIERDLAAICEKALERDPDDRYRSAEELARDLGRYLAGEPVVARPRHLRRRAQHALTRRRLLKALPAVAAAAAGLGYLERARRARVAERQGLPVLRARVRNATGGVTAFHRALGDAFDGWRPETRIGRSASERLELRVPAGEGRVVLVDERGAFAEVRRAFSSDTAYELEVLLATPEDVEESMRRIESGVTDVAVARFSGGSARMEREDAAYGGFLIDVRPVTHEDYKRFLEATRGFPDPAWDEGERQLWLDPPRDDWADLPMTKLAPVEAMEYAEWAGKRLPTWTEWNAAALADGLTWLTGAQRDPATTPFNVGKPSPWVDDDEYLKHVAAVPEDAPLFGPHRLAQPLGNVREMMESSLGPGARIVTGSAWYSRPQDALGQFATFPALTTDNDRGVDRGFRCAKSLRPLS